MKKRIVAIIISAAVLALPHISSASPASLGISEPSVDTERWRAEVLSCAGEGLSELEYALFFHDHLAANYEYDGTDTVCDLSELIKSGRGSSYAYAAAYACLLESVGISACTVSSAEMEHSWNLVQLGGDVYHVDVAHDDRGDLGGARHKFFLMSDSAAATPSADEPLGHYGWESQLTCTSELYDDIPLKEVCGATARLGDRLYYAADGKLCAMDSVTASPYAVLDLPWDTEPSDTPVYASVLSYGGYLYVCTPSSLLRVDPASGSVTVHYRCGGDEVICGFGINTDEDGSVRLTVSSPASETHTVLLDLRKAPAVRGDADGNGTLGLSDATAVLKYLTDSSTSLDLSAADINGDGVISLADVTMILKILAGWNV